ncbi:MAG: GerMN domain-containing protein [Clostridia bacterium]|nr:GerMN domain-containing protein [Clostridia bacterium]
MVTKGYARRALLMLWLAAAAMLLGGCVSQIDERGMADLSQKAIRCDIAAPQQDGADGKEALFTLYFLAEDGVTLRPVTRRCAFDGGMSRAQAALDALLGGPAEEETGVIWPDMGKAQADRMLEVSCGVATVDLSAYARTLPQETLYAVRMAIANTLTEFSEISYVNVLIGGREEGLDLGATLPVGTLVHYDELNAGQRYSRLLDQRYSESGVTLLTTLYFPAAGGRLILPEVRSIAYAQVTPIEYLYTILDELGKGAGHPLCVEDFPAPMEYIEEMPEIVRTEDGYLAIELCFDRQIEEDLARCGLTMGVYLAMLSDTLLGFVPGVEGLKVSVGDMDMTEIAAQQTPDGEEIVFEHGLAVRRDFAGYVGAPVTLYAMCEGGLERVQRVMDQSLASSARAKLEILLALPGDGHDAPAHGLLEKDILAVHTGTDAIAVNLSAAFCDAMKTASLQQERAAVYAMVNTLTENSDIPRVAFFFEGEQVETLAGGLEMRGTFMRNPGMVVD